MPIAQRGKAKQKRSGLGLMVTRDGRIPLARHAYSGHRPDVTQFPAMIDQLHGQYQAVCAAAEVPAAADMTVVLDAGHNSEDNFAHLAGTGRHYIRSARTSSYSRSGSWRSSLLLEHARYDGQVLLAEPLINGLLPFVS